MLLRGCTYAGRQASTWSADLLEAKADVPEDLKREVLGARRKILFVEGTHESLDKTLYAVLYPDVSVIPKGSCREVEQAVEAVRETQAVHWVQPFGIVDGDGRVEDDVTALYRAGIIATEWYSVESVYYHPEVFSGIARRVAALDDSDPDVRIQNSIDAVLAGAANNREHLCERVAKQSVREAVFASLPGKHLTDDIKINVPVTELLEAEYSRFDRAIEERDTNSLIRRYPLRESQALTGVSNALGFQSRIAYEAAVVKAVSEDTEVRATIEQLMEHLSALVRDVEEASKQPTAADSFPPSG